MKKKTIEKFKHLYFFHIDSFIFWTNQLTYFAIYKKRVPSNFGRPFNINYFKNQACQFTTFILYICQLKQKKLLINMLIVHIRNF